MSKYLRYCCTECKKEYTNKEYQRHIISSYHLTYTDDKKEQQKLHKQMHRRQYYIENKENECKKYDCECGGSYTYANKSKHEKTKKHQTYISTL